MAKEQNLIRLSSEEARKNGRKGGKASAAARRERKQLREELLLLLSDGNIQEKICVALIKQAQKGNTKAFEIVRDTIGEKPDDKLQLSGEVQIDDARARLVEKINQGRGQSKTK